MIITLCYNLFSILLLYLNVKSRLTKFKKKIFTRSHKNIDIFEISKVIIPTHSLCSSLGTSSPHLIQLSSDTSIESSGHAQNKAFADVGTLLPGHIPKKVDKI